MTANENALELDQRDAQGRFVPGHTLGIGGRPPGALDLMSVCKRAAAEKGTSLEKMMWQVVEGMHIAAVVGDTKAAALLLDRFCGVLEKAAGVEVNINNGTVNNGPPEPTTRDLGVYFERLGELSGKLQTVELEPKVDEVEELLG